MKHKCLHCIVKCIVFYVKAGSTHSTGFWWGDVTETDHLEDLGADGRIILKQILKKWDREAWTELIWLRWRALVKAVMNLRVP